MACHKLDKTRLDLDIYCWFFSVVTVLSLVGVVSWLSLMPKNPHIRISGLQFPTLDSRNHSVHHNVSLSNNSLIFDLQIFNPNKRMGIYYSSISLELFDNGGLVGANSTPAFHQGYRDTTLFRILIHPRQEFWEAMDSASAEFRVRVETAVRFWIIKWKTKARRIKHEEQFSKVKSNLNGTFLGGNYAKLQ